MPIFLHLKDVKIRVCYACGNVDVVKIKIEDCEKKRSSEQIDAKHYTLTVMPGSLVEWGKGIGKKRSEF